DTGYITKRMDSLRQGNKAEMHRPIPLVSSDEIGLLASRFNVVQEQISDAYAEIDRQVRLAGEIQQKLLPSSLPSNDRLELAAHCQQGRIVGGDFYDAIVVDEHHVAIVIGDVAGKGVPAALVMSAAMVLLRAEISGTSTAADTLSRLNRLLCDTIQGDIYLTMGLGLLDLRTGTLEYASAGHLSPYIVR